MAFTIDDFDKVWASQSPLTPYEFSESNYKQGWDFVGATPPSRQMWDYLQKLTDEKIKYIYNNMIPVGVVQAYAGQTTPQGWLLCDGSAISRTQYSKLFGVIGTSYGAGDGTSTFNLPNLTDKFIEGSSTSGTEHSAGLPNITGMADFYKDRGGINPDTTDGAFYGGDPSANIPLMGEQVEGYRTDGYLYLDASRSSSIYGNSATVQPPSVTMRYIIKY